MLKTALFDCAIDEKCCSVDGGGAFALFFRSHPWGFDSSRVPTSGQNKKKMLLLGGQPEGGGGGVLVAAGIDWCIMSGRTEYCRKNLVANCFGNFGKKNNKTNCQKCIEKIANIARITNLTRIANCSKTLLLMFVAILAKIHLIEIAGKNLVFKSAKIAKVTRTLIAPKKHPDNLSQE